MIVSPALSLSSSKQQDLNQTTLTYALFDQDRKTNQWLQVSSFLHNVFFSVQQKKRISNRFITITDGVNESGIKILGVNCAFNVHVNMLWDVFDL